MKDCGWSIRSELKQVEAIELSADQRSGNQICGKSGKFVDFFLENYVTSEGAVFHNFLYYQQLFIAYYQVSFYANNYFE